MSNANFYGTPRRPSRIAVKKRFTTLPDILRISKSAQRRASLQISDKRFEFD
jgi:hypothetical protein